MGMGTVVEVTLMVVIVHGDSRNRYSSNPSVVCQYAQL